MEYKNGIGTSVNLLLTQRQMLSVSSQVLELERMRLENRVNLHLSLGGTVKKQWKWAQIIAVLVIGLLGVIIFSLLVATKPESY